jgi:heptosyltransferase-3
MSGDIMRLLFIKLKHIGDVFLLTPTLDAVRCRYPDAEISVLVRKGTEGILAGCSAIDRVYVTVAAERENRTRGDAWATVRLIRQLRETEFDTVFVISPEDRASVYGILMRARNRIMAPCARSKLAKQLAVFYKVAPLSIVGSHEVERSFAVAREVLDLPSRPGSLQFREAVGAGGRLIPEGRNYAVLHTATRWPTKGWPVEHWVSFIERIIDRFDTLVVSVGPAREEVAMGRLIARGFDSRVISTEGQLSWSQLAALIRGSKLFLGVDTAAMHLAAACDIPIVALFGPSRKCFWRPWTDAPCVVLSDPHYIGENDTFADHCIDRRVEAITPSMVVDAVDQVIEDAEIPKTKEAISERWGDLFSTPTLDYAIPG